MAKGPTNAWDVLNGKVSVPAELRTVEWQRVPQWVKERSFYMAGVHRAEILEEFRQNIALQAAGSQGEEASIKKLQQFLAQANYQPEPGQEGTIKDLSSVRRILVSLRTNQRLLQGYGQKMAGLDPDQMRAFPAWELVRVGAAKAPRIWTARFEKVGGVLIEGRIIALKQDLVWAELGDPRNFKDAIGVDYPPLAWGSHMRFKPVPFRECKRLGLLEGWVPPSNRQPLDSPNESLEMTPRVKSPEIRTALTEHLKGLAEWRGETLVFTDPNGTRPAMPERLAELWKRPLPAAFSELPGEGQTQREAFLQWVIDSGVYWNDLTPGSEATRLGGTNLWADFLRVLKRLQPTGRETGELFRGLSWNNNEAFSAFMQKVRNEGYSARPETPAESWAASQAAAQKYVSGENYRVILKLPAGHSKGRDIAPLVRAFQDELLRREVPQGKLALTDNEIILPSWAGLKVKKIGKVTDTAAGKSVEITMEEAP